MSFHSFTQIKDWTGDERTDGVEADIEFEDQFGDPAKATGTFIFELYDFRRADPDPRGKRLALWQGSLQSLEEQRQLWNKISRTYGFKLEQPAKYPLSINKSYVLDATFQSAGGGRLFARCILQAREEEPSATQPTTQPVTQPATEPATQGVARPGSRPTEP